jgi:hypothetical protein
MAIYHFSVKTISRSEGRSAVAAAAYRSGEKLTCDYYGKEQDYTKKSGVEFTGLYGPENTSPDLLNRQNLWNKVEQVERRKDALLAREFEIAFPQELNKEQRQAMLNELCQDLVKRHGVIVDAAIHAPHTDGGSDERNYHAHIMFTTRAIDPENGEFSAKKYRDFSRDNGTETVSNWREHFATLTNDHLAKAGYDVRVDHRSYKDQENGLEATIHEGYEVTQLRRNGIETEISVSNNLIKQRNAEKIESQKLLKDIDQEIWATEQLITTLEQKTTIESILNEEKTTDFDNFDQIIQKPNEMRSEKNIFDTLNSSISQLTRSELFSTLDKTLESHAEVEREAAVKANVEREAKHQAELKADAEHQAQETEPKAERKATIEREKEHQNDRGNDFHPF